MRNFKFKRSLTLVAASSLLSLTVVSIPTAAQATPVCTTANFVTSCVGATSDTAPYSMMVPANFNGTVYLYSHGYRPNVPVPAGIPGYGGYTVTNTPQPGPNATVIGALLAKGYGVVGSGFARQGWNADSAIKTNVELVGIFKKQFTKTTKVVAWGESLGGFITQALAEKHPDLFSAAAPLCMASDITPLMTMAGDALWGIKTFFDPTIKGGNYSAGAAGYAEAMGDLVKVFTVIGSLQAAFAANASTPAWPATSKVPDAIKAIPSRSALVMVALMSGVPLQSAHFDSTSAPSVLPVASQTSFQLAINPAFAALENVANAAALAVLATHDLELQAGGAVFDNTATNYAARIADEQFIWSSALSGASGTAGLLSVLAASPRAKASPAAVEKLKTLASHSGKVEIPTILFTGVADPVTTAGNQQSVVDDYAAYWADKWAAAKKAGERKRPANNQLVLWNFPPEKYTKYSAAGAPDTTVAAATGTNHCNFSTSQYMAVADLLAYAADNGKNMSGGALLTKLRKAGNMTYDRGYSAPRLKFYGN
ncbi:MAG TPA: prolyl oligopeptidase family serine peptidase [Candidatus Nanopelagicaceae bacterium]|jgi:pimeloyl-ACP methyl ester carboxylesterase|nr:prolyl oligopeptidase family serine peptidase [Candidatus Nanopelagicaceae bacterium]